MKSKIRLLAGVVCLLVVAVCVLALSACGSKECEEHKWGSWSITTGATCTTDGVNGRTCLECGATETNVLPAKGHSPVTSGIGCEAKSTCSACGEVLEGGAATHVGGTATCTSPAVCTICNMPYGELGAHTGGTATCSAQAVCTLCSTPYGELDPETHSGTAWVKDRSTHSSVCSGCSASLSETEDHTTIDGICTVCGFAPTVEGAYAEAVIEESATEDIEVELTISIEDNPGILGLSLTLEYNEALFTLTEAANGSALEVLDFSAPDTLGSGATFIWDGLYLEEDDIVDGDILTLTFTVSASAPAGEYAILLRASAINNDLAPIVIAFESAKIVVKTA